MKENEIPNYYSVIPAKVRYCPDLTFFEIVLYSEISALTNAFGYCFASNSYFARLYRKDCPTISKAVAKLVEFGFLFVEIDKKLGNKRKIFITPIVVDDNSPIVKNDKTPIVVDDNNNITSLNNELKQTRACEDIAELFSRVYKGRR